MMLSHTGAAESRRQPPAQFELFETPEISAIPGLLLESFRLRYQVYCVERQFLPVSHYPRGIEADAFDLSSVHVGAVDTEGRLAGTARLVLPDGGRLPTLSYCAPAALEGPLWSADARWAEASRLSVSRSYGAPGRRAGRSDHGPDGHSRGLVFLAVMKGLYRASKRLDITHWLVSIERPLARLLARHGFPFRQLGPEFEYLGPVAPYSLCLAELDAVIAGGRFPHLADFPTASDTSAGVVIEPTGRF